MTRKLTNHVFKMNDIQYVYQWYTLIKKEDAVKYTKAHRIKCLGCLNRMEVIKLVKKISDWNPIGVRTKERPKNRWRDKVMHDLKKLNWETGANASKIEKPGMIWCRRPKPC